MITFASFLFVDKFTQMSEADFAVISDIVSAEWSGVDSLWAGLPLEVRTAKRNLCYHYLVAWAYADMFPDRVKGFLSNAGVPMIKKRIEDAEISFDVFHIQAGLKMLTTNVFGLRALNLILSAPERMGAYG